MGTLKIIRRPSKSPQIGDMRTRISIFARLMEAPLFGSASFTQNPGLIATIWSNVITVTTQTGGIQVFDNVEISENITHVFTIRFRDDIVTKNIVQLDNDNYKIIKTDNPDLRKRFLSLSCELLGDQNFEANQ